MQNITIVDARMGRGKSSAAIRYMQENSDKKRFLYITPYLDEVDRICEKCEFNQAEECYTTKSAQLKNMLYRKKNIAATHSLFHLMNEETLAVAKEMDYHLIIDESLSVVGKIKLSKSDMDLIGNQTELRENGSVKWKSNDYTGVFGEIKRLAMCGSLFNICGTYFEVFNTQMFEAFDNIHILTYLFDGQCLKGYFDYFHIPYKVVGIKEDECGFYFSDERDNPPSIDYHDLIHIIDDDKMNKIGENKFALSCSWFTTHSAKSREMIRLRGNLRKFFSMCGGGAHTYLWTTFKEGKRKIIEPKTNRYSSSFLQVSARATNSYRNRTNVAYLANRFMDPNITKFLSRGGVSIDPDLFALSEMLQWIWRSAIRDGKPINLYVPSKRMRTLLTDWIDRVSRGLPPYEIHNEKEPV